LGPLDLQGLGPHTFRRANITWREAVGASAIGASKIPGHAEVQMTSEYTYVALERQQELTQAIQERLRAAAEKVGQQRKQLGPPAVPAPASRRMTSSGLCAGWCVEMTGGGR